jgi:hypothetical protein
MLYDDPHLTGQGIVTSVINHSQAQLVNSYRIARRVPDIEETACDPGFVDITEYTPGGGVLPRSHFDFVILEIRDIGRT